MRKGILLILLMMSVGFANAQKYVINDPKAVKREVGSFNGVSVGSAISLYVSQSDESALAISVPDESMRPFVKTEVKGGALNIWFDSKNWKKQSGWKSANKIKVYVTSKEIKKLEGSGASVVTVLGQIKMTNLSVSLSGASDMTGDFKCDKLDMELSGASDAKLKGDVKYFSMSLDGASTLKGYDLQVGNCEIDASGASNAEITVGSEIVVSASGASDVKIKGAGVIKDMKSSGASQIKKMEK